MSYSSAGRRGSAGYQPSASSATSGFGSSSSKPYSSSSYMVPASALSNLLFRSSNTPTPTPTQAAYLSHSNSGSGFGGSGGGGALVFQPRNTAATRSRSIHGNSSKASEPTSYSARSRYNDSSNDKTSTSSTTPSYRTARTPSISSISSVVSEKGENDNPEQDWKKLYDQEKSENEKLKKKLQTAERDLEDIKSLQRSDRTPSERASETEKRERRALERKLAEMEEELKELETLRADNQRLKEENGALIRVISKLSK